MLNLKELIDMGCAHTMVDSDGGCTRAAGPSWRYAIGPIMATGTVTAASANSTPDRLEPNLPR